MGIESIPTIAMTLILIVITTVIGAWIIGDLGDTIIENTDKINNDVVNEVHTNQTSFYLGRAFNNTVRGYSLDTVLLRNVTVGYTINSGNYTVNAADGNITLVAGFGLNAGTERFYVNYTYSVFEPSVAFNATTEGGDAVFTIAEWLPIIAIVIAATVIIGLIVWFGKVGQ